MKKQKTQSKIIVALTAVVILLVAISATLTFAYFTATNQATSTSMTFGELNLGDSAGLTLTNADTTAHTSVVSGTIQYVVPGCSFSLAGDITVTGNIDALVRAQLMVQVIQTHDENGTAFAYTDGTNGVHKYKLDAGKYVQDDVEGSIVGKLTEAYGTTQNGKAATVYGKIDTVMASKSGSTAWVKVGDYTYFPKVVTATTAGTSVLDFGDNSEILFEAATFGNDWQGAMVKVFFVTEVIQAEHLVDTNGDDIVITKAAPVSNLSALTDVKVDGTSVKVDADVDDTLEMVTAIADAAAWNAISTNGVITPPVTP